MKKYKLGDVHPEKNLYRIVALRDFGDVKAGDVGGWVAGEHNLSHEGDCWIYDEAWVFGDACVFENAKVYGSIYKENRHHEGNVYVYGNAKIYGNARVYENARLSGHAQIYGNAKIYGNARVYGYAKVYGNAQIFGNTYVCEECTVSGCAIITDNARVYGNSHICGDAVVDGKSIIEYGILESSPTIEDLLRCSIGIPAVDGVVRLFGRVNSDMSSEHDNAFIYPQFGLVEMQSEKRDLYFSHINKRYSYWRISSLTHKIIAADIRVEDIICIQNGAVRCRRATIVGVV